MTPILYRLLSVLTLIAIMAIISLLTMGKTKEIIIPIVVILGSYAAQLKFRCPHCGAKPALWLLAIWTILLDFHLYFADAILLRECPKCDVRFKDMGEKIHNKSTQ